MSRIQFSQLSQAADLEALGERFDWALGFVAPDQRSIQNLREVAPYAQGRRAYLPCDPEQPTAQGAQRLRTNVRALTGFECVVWSDEAMLALEHGLTESMVDGRELSVFLDVSAFPRRALAAVLDLIRCLVQTGAQIRLTIAYRLAIYSKPREEPLPPNRRVAPVHPSVAGWPRMPGLPVQLLVGLGYERGKALGAVEYIQPTRWRLLLPESPEPRYLIQVQEKNQDLIAGTPEHNRYLYQVLDPAGQFTLLSSMLIPMLDTTKPVLLPFGPKILFAVCILLSYRFREIAVWHVSGEEEEAAILNKPSAHAVYFACSLANEPVSAH